MYKKKFLPFCLMIAVFIGSAFKMPFSENDSHILMQRQALRTIIIDPGHGLPDGGADGKNGTESHYALEIALKLGEQLKQNLPGVNIIFTRTDEYLPDHLSNKNDALKRRAQIANENHGDLFISIHLNSGQDSYSKEVIDHRKEIYYTYSGKGKKRKRTAHTRTVPVYKYTNLGTSAVGTETFIWAVGKNTSKQSFVGAGEETGEPDDSTSSLAFDSPEAKILASIRTKKFFNYSRMLAEYVQEEFSKQGRVDRGAKQRDNEGIWVLQATAMPSILVETGFVNNREEEDYLDSDKGQNEVAYAIMRAVLHYKTSLENGNIPTTPPATDSTQQVNAGQ
jgi:N-acetylmuramoyl-L-alanine amidase